MHCTIKESFTALCWEVATPFAYRALKKFESGEWLWLVSQDIKPVDYLCPRVFYGDAQVAAFFKKFKDFNLEIDRKAVAEATFWNAEKQCYLSNERLSPLLFDEGHYGKGIKTFIQKWKKIVRSVLGDEPDYTKLSNVKFGPGSTYANRSDKILLADKLDSSYTVTTTAANWLPFLEQTAWLRTAARPNQLVDVDYDVRVGSLGSPTFYATRIFDLVRGNRFTTVDKNAKTDRGICIEASANVSFQLAMGSEISELLRRAFGWDKRTCQEYHRLLARLGSLTGAVATIDLSNASDTVCLALVKLILPPAWFRLLSDLRSTHTQVGSGWVKLEKFSSMGNGFTFELETLLFRSLIETVRQLVDREVDYTPGVDYSVFGDDIICPTRVSEDVVSALKFFGFTPNEKKTFLKGPFRESCGGDYYRGNDVRPHFVVDDIVQPSELITLANGVRRFSKRYQQTSPGSNRDLRCWRLILRSIPSNIRACRGPEVLGDLVINDDEANWNYQVRNCIRYFRVWRPVANQPLSWSHWRPHVVLASALYGVPSGTPPIRPGDDVNDKFRRSGVVPRLGGSYVSGYRFGRVAYS